MGKKRSVLPYIPGYDNNTVLKLIFFIAGCYIATALTWAVIMMVYIDDANFNTYFVSYLSLPALSAFPMRWWTIFSYGFFHVPNSFMNMLSNMLWLYCFGSVVQMFIGKKQIIPLYMYSLLAGGVFYLLAQLLPGELGKVPPYIMGPRAGLVGMCAAAITITPKYNFYLTETFRIPIWAVAGIFAVLTIMGSGFYLPAIVMLLAGGLSGYGYVKLLQAGYRPGGWIYDIAGKVEGFATPVKENNIYRGPKGRNIPLNTYTDRKDIPLQKRIDDVLDKINQKGFDSLSAEEREILKKAADKG